jgi:hypothetical protein
MNLQFFFLNFIRIKFITTYIFYLEFTLFLNLIPLAIVYSHLYFIVLMIEWS